MTDAQLASEHERQATDWRDLAARMEVAGYYTAALEAVRAAERCDRIAAALREHALTAAAAAAGA